MYLPVGSVVGLLCVACASCAARSSPTVHAAAPARAPVAPTPPPAPPAAKAPPAATFTDLAGTWKSVMNEGMPSAIESEAQVARLPSGDYVGRVLVPSQGAELRASAITLNGDAI